MTFMIMLGLYTLVLFAVGFLSRRSMGVPSLALTAGAVLAKLWTDSLTPLVASTGIIIIRPPLESLVAIALTLIPALLIMVRSGKSHGLGHSIVSSTVFAVLAVMLTYGAFANAIVLDESSRVYAQQLISYDRVIITAAIIIAIIEVLFHKRPHPRMHHK